MQRTLSAPLFLALAASPALAQGPIFQTPGTPVMSTPSASSSDSGQADRFASAFNPAFSFLVDTVADYVDFDQNSDDSGFGAQLRTLEMAAQAWVDPNAWAYFVGASEDEALAIEEAAIHYTGFGNSTIRAGRFFVDFGKQMQTHVHELRTLERPLVLRAYLGDEVKGDGVQWDHWLPVGDDAALRWSLGAFASLLPEETAFPTADVVTEVAERKDAGDLNFTARVTGFMDFGEASTLQLGASARAIPDYSVADEVNALGQSGLDSTVFGFDATYGWVSETGEERFTLGAEALVSAGDTGFSVDDPDTTPGTGDETLTVLDDSVFGYFAFADYAWDRFHSAGLQFSAAELPDAASSDASEIEAYFTRWFSEFHRLRFVVASTQDDTSDDALRFALQYTGIVGAHGHGINW
ncbi:MAG: porin [Planctomycetota bacterium]